MRFGNQVPTPFHPGAANDTWLRGHFMQRMSAVFLSLITWRSSLLTKRCGCPGQAARAVSCSGHPRPAGACPREGSRPPLPSPPAHIAQHTGGSRSWGAITDPAVSAGPDRASLDFAGLRVIASDLVAAGGVELP